MSDTATPPTKVRPNALRNYERFSEAGNLATAMGNTADAQSAQNRVARILGRNPGLDTSGVDVNKFSDWSTMGPGNNDMAVNALTQLHQGQFNRSGNYDVARNRYQIGLNKSIEGKMKQGLQGEILPGLNAANDKAQANLNTSAISATDENALRSRIAQTVNTAAAQQNARTAAMLGLGNMSNSPAAAALAAQSGEQAANAIASSVRDMGLQVSAANREQSRADIELAQRIGMAKYNVLNGDSKSLIGMQGDIASMLDALYSRDQTLAMMQKQIHDAGQTSLADRLSQWTSVGSGILGLGGGMAQAFGRGGGKSPTPMQAGQAGYGANQAIGMASMGAMGMY